MENNTRFNIGDEAWYICKLHKARKGIVIGITTKQIGVERSNGRISIGSQFVDYVITHPCFDGKQDVPCSFTFKTKEDLINSL